VNHLFALPGFEDEVFRVAFHCRILRKQAKSGRRGEQTNVF
jgi:hypothetical protein